MAALVGAAAIGVQRIWFGARAHEALARACEAARLRRPNEASHQLGVLLAGRALDAGGDIDQSGPGQR